MLTNLRESGQAGWGGTGRWIVWMTRTREGVPVSGS